MDEAHSSQTGETARELKAILGASTQTENDEEPPDWEDRLNQVMQSRGPQPNLSFFAFTATPKGKTLELFGRPGPGGMPEAFHLYSLRQAIEEGLIVDVVKNYTTYKTYYRLVKAVEADPDMPKKKAARALANFMSLHSYNIEQKTEVIIEHFRHKVMPLLGGKAKAMVVTASRLHAVRYKEAFEHYLTENKIADVRPLVAFTGTVKDPDTGMEYTEPGMNTDCVSGKPIGAKQLPERSPRRITRCISGARSKLMPGSSTSCSPASRRRIMQPCSFIFSPLWIVSRRWTMMRFAASSARSSKAT